MFSDFESAHGATLDAVIASALSTLSGEDEASDKYTKTTENLVKLVKLRNEAAKLEYDAQAEADRIRNESAKIDIEAEKLQFEQAKHNTWRPSPDAVIGVVGTIAAAILVLNYEKAGVITSKAFAFIGKTMR